MKEYIRTDGSTGTFAKKSKELQRTINEALSIIESLGTPLSDLTPRRMERMALCLMSLGNVKRSADWKDTKDISQGISMKSRDIIKYINSNLHDKISPGSYDDIRRKDLKMLVLNGIVVGTKPGSAINDPARGYAISKEHAEIIRAFGSEEWEAAVKDFLKSRPTLSDQLSGIRKMKTVPIMLPNKHKLLFSLGEHNILQKAIIEQFLPRFGHGAEILYVGDTAKKLLYKQEHGLKQLKFFDLSHGKLPDIIAYSPSKNWLFLVEAVHAFGPISDTRLLDLKKLTESCTAEIVYVTAFMKKADFRKFSNQIAWETEVWIAESPDHLIHFNGEKFVGPYKKT